MFVWGFVKEREMDDEQRILQVLPSFSLFLELETFPMSIVSFQHMENWDAGQKSLLGEHEIQDRPT